MKNNRRKSLPSQSISPRYQALEKGNILKEIDRLRNLDVHHRRINAIITADPYKQRKGSHALGSLELLDKYKSLKPKGSHYRKECKFLDGAITSVENQMEINRQNVKILQRIVDAR